MKVKCPKCKKPGITTRFFSVSNDLHCRVCFSRYRLKAEQPWLLHVMYCTALTLAVVMGLKFASWLVFLAVFLVGGFLVVCFVPSKKKLIALKPKVANNA